MALNNFAFPFFLFSFLLDLGQRPCTEYRSMDAPSIVCHDIVLTMFALFRVLGIGESPK